MVGVCLFGSVALIDRSAGAGLDLIAGLATVAALDRLLGRGSDLVAGPWTGLAFLAAGWPPVVLILLATVVIGRPESSLSFRLLVPPARGGRGLVGLGLSVAPAEAWGAALALPLTQKSAWMLAVGVVLLGLPWCPFAAFAASRSVREGWPPEGRALVMGWLQTTAACLVAGTVVPGLASASRVPALAGLAVVAAACCDRAWAGSLSTAARRAFLTLSLTSVVLWVALVIGRRYVPGQRRLLLPRGVHRADGPGHGDGRDRLGGRPKARAEAGRGSRLRRRGRPETRPRRLLRPGVELPTQSGPLGTRHRPVGPATTSRSIPSTPGRPTSPSPSAGRSASSPTPGPWPSRWPIIPNSSSCSTPNSSTGPKGPSLLKVAAFQDEHGRGRVLADRRRFFLAPDGRGGSGR